MTPTPVPIEIVNSTTTDWVGPLIASLGALVGALVGGLIASFSVRASDRRRQQAEDLRQWDSLVLAQLARVRKSLDPFWDARYIGDDDGRRFGLLSASLSRSVMEIRDAEERFSIIAPKCATITGHIGDQLRLAIELADRNKAPTAQLAEDVVRLNTELSAEVRRQLRIPDTTP
ncbi:hypothetical protein ACRAWC_01700 [Leifsonia sp. L25]|uniref:hypothetical protein n=1 Tax=Actinomycetes TaxID=1760 RepID=UPI003D68F0AA